MNRSSVNPTLFLALTVFALVASVGLGYWQYTSASTKEAKVRKMKHEIGGTPNLVQQAELVQLQVQQTHMELTHLELGVATAEYVPTLLQELEATGKQSGLEITGVRPMPKQQKKKPTEGEETNEVRKAYEELDVEVRCKGEFHAIMTFLQRLADFPKIVAVRHMSLEPKVKPDALTLEAIETNIVLRVYVFSQVHQPTTQLKLDQNTAGAG